MRVCTLHGMGTWPCTLCDAKAAQHVAVIEAAFALNDEMVLARLRVALQAEDLKSLARVGVVKADDVQIVVHEIVQRAALAVKARIEKVTIGLLGKPVRDVGQLQRELSAASDEEFNRVWNAFFKPDPAPEELDDTELNITLLDEVAEEIDR